MIITKYKLFLEKHQNKIENINNVFESDKWNIDEVLINDLFMYLYDLGLELKIHKSYSMEIEKFDSYTIPLNLENDFVLPNQDYNYTYEFELTPKVDTINAEIEFNEFIENLNQIFNSNLERMYCVYAYPYDIDLDKFKCKVEDGYFVNEFSNDINFNIEEIYFTYVLPEKVKFTIKEIMDSYKSKFDYGSGNYDYDYEKDGNIYFKYTRDGFLDIINISSDYEDIIRGGIDVMSEYYIYGFYEMDLINLTYYFNKDNMKLFVKTIIYDLGGYEKVINNISEYNNDLNLNSFKNENELIDFLINERSYETLSNMFDTESVLYIDVNGLWRDYDRNAHMNENYKEIMTVYENELDETFDYFIKDDYYYVLLKDDFFESDIMKD